MGTKKKNLPSSKNVKDHDQKLVKPDNYLETDKAHKNWYNIHEMGKQRGVPKIIRETKKPSGIRKHSLRKEK